MTDGAPGRGELTMVTESVEYVVLQATVNGLVREELEGELNRHAGSGYHIAHVLTEYIVMERRTAPDEPGGRDHSR